MSTLYIEEGIDKNKQERALRKSIEHWQRLRDGTQDDGEGISANSCACCMSFYECKGCPIANYTKRTSCVETPYYKASDAWRWRHNDAEDMDRWERAADKELEFLKKVYKDTFGEEYKPL